MQLVGGHRRGADAGVSADASEVEYFWNSETGAGNRPAPFSFSLLAHQLDVGTQLRVALS